MMQWDPFLTQLFLIDGGGILALVLLAPAIALRLCAKYIEDVAKESADETRGDTRAISSLINNRPRTVTGLYAFCNGLSALLTTTWFMVVFGFLASVAVFLCVSLMFAMVPFSISGIESELKQNAKEQYD